MVRGLTRALCELNVLHLTHGNKDSDSCAHSREIELAVPNRPLLLGLGTALRTSLLIRLAAELQIRTSKG